MSEQTYIAVGLAVANVALYSGAAYQLLRRGKSPTVEAAGPAAFVELMEALRKADPTLPRGFTWREALVRVRATGVRADWAGVDKDLSAYESYRYGGGAPLSIYKGVGSLARELRKAA